MKVLKSLFGSKYFPWCLIVLGVLGFFKFKSLQDNKYEEQNRLLSGKLTEKEQQLQAFNKELGLAKSELVSQKELNDILKKDKDNLSAEFEAFKKKHDLIIAAKDQTIAELQAQIIGGQSETEVSGCDLPTGCIIAYNWQDVFKRFYLQDPNIFTQQDEVFTNRQFFIIEGEVYKQKNSILQTRRIRLSEVYKIEENGKEVYKQVPNSKIDIVDSKFYYTIQDEEEKLFNLRYFGGAAYNFESVGIITGIEFLNWKSVGINSSTFFDTKDIRLTQQRIGISYTPKLFGEKLNIGVGNSLGTYYGNLFKKFNVSFDLIFFINN